MRHPPLVYWKYANEIIHAVMDFGGGSRHAAHDRLERNGIIHAAIGNESRVDGIPTRPACRSERGECCRNLRAACRQVVQDWLWNLMASPAGPPGHLFQMCKSKTEPVITFCRDFGSLQPTGSLEAVNRMLDEVLKHIQPGANYGLRTSLGNFENQKQCGPALQLLELPTGASALDEPSNPPNPCL